MSTRHSQLDMLRGGSPPPCWREKTDKLGMKLKIRQTLTTNASLTTISDTFDSLFRVLFIFPSRYLWAIGLPLAYLALGGIYHPFRAAISSNPTLQTYPVFRFCVVWPKKVFFQQRRKKSNGGFTLYAVPFQESLIFFHRNAKKKEELPPLFFWPPTEKIVSVNAKGEKVWKDYNSGWGVGFPARF